MESVSSVSSLLELDDAPLEVSDGPELVVELLKEGVERWRLREGVMGAGEPIRVRGLVATDRFDVVVA